MTSKHRVTLVFSDKTLSQELYVFGFGEIIIRTIQNKQKYNFFRCCELFQLISNLAKVEQGEDLPSSPTPQQIYSSEARTFKQFLLAD